MENLRSLALRLESNKMCFCKDKIFSLLPKQPTVCYGFAMMNHSSIPPNINVVFFRVAKVSPMKGGTATDR